MEEKKNDMGFIWIIIILIVLVLVLVGYIIYDKSMIGNKLTITENQNDKGNNKEVEVVDAANFTSTYYLDDTIKFVLPKIINGGKNSEKLNKIILDTVLSNNVIPNSSDEESEYPKSIKTEYSYRKIGDILIIDVQASKKPWNASGTGDSSYIFYYHISDDKILNEYDVLIYSGYDENEILDKVRNSYSDNTYCDYGEENIEKSLTTEKIKELFEKGLLKLIITDKNDVIIQWDYCIL